MAIVNTVSGLQQAFENKSENWISEIRFLQESAIHKQNPGQCKSIGRADLSTAFVTFRTRRFFAKIKQCGALDSFFQILQADQIDSAGGRQRSGFSAAITGSFRVWDCQFIFVIYVNEKTLADVTASRSFRFSTSC